MTLERLFSRVLILYYYLEVSREKIDFNPKAKLAYPYMRDSAPFDIKNGKLYQLITGDDEEECELHVSRVE
jgi:hypothetical protein